MITTMAAVMLEGFPRTRSEKPSSVVVAHGRDQVDGGASGRCTAQARATARARVDGRSQRALHGRVGLRPEGSDRKRCVVDVYRCGAVVPDLKGDAVDRAGFEDRVAAQELFAVAERGEDGRVDGFGVQRVVVGDGGVSEAG